MRRNVGHLTKLWKEEYIDMVKMFKDHQHVYEGNKKYKRIEIKNDDTSWKKIYQEIENY